MGQDAPALRGLRVLSGLLDAPASLRHSLCEVGLLTRLLLGLISLCAALPVFDITVHLIPSGHDDNFVLTAAFYVREHIVTSHCAAKH